MSVSTAVAVAAIEAPEPTAQRRARQSVTNRRPSWHLTVLMWLAGAVWLFPLVVVVITSLKTAGGMTTSKPLALDSSPQFGNYATAWRDAHMGSYMLNSLLICVIKVPLGLVISAMTAFGLSRFRFRLRRTLFLLVVAGSMIPLQIPLISLFTTLLKVNLLNTYTGLILPYLAFGLPFQVIFLTTFFDQVPKEIEDAAKIDGCRPWRYLVSVLIPLCRPIIASLLILDLVGTFNEFSVALTVLQDNRLWTVPLGLIGFQGTYSSQYTLISAAVVMAVLPILVIYLTLQRYFERGFVSGAVTG
jgi:raffinose/stachyose/melibiose transport system permease protein